MTDRVIEAHESWDGFIFAAVKETDTDLYRVVMTMKDGTTIRSRPYGTQERVLARLHHAYKKGFIPNDMDDQTGDLVPEESVIHPPGWGRFA